MTRLRAAGLLPLLLLLGCAAAASVQAGDALPDPTRPSTAAVAAEAAASALQAEPAWVLQSVRLGAGGNHAALINGTLVPLGACIGKGRLVRLTEHSAVLEGPDGLKTLSLITEVHKRNARPVAGQPAGPLAAKAARPACAAEFTP